MSKGNKRKVIIIGITIITLIEIYFAYKVFKDYRGIYPVAMFILLLSQPRVYYNLFTHLLE